MRNRGWLPYVMMAVVIGMYGIKVVCKLWIGGEINSPTITGDGMHNVADLFEALLIVAAVAISRMEPDDRYPFGRKNVESIARAAIGVGLLVTALHFAATSLLGIARALGWGPAIEAASPIPLPWPETLKMGPEVLWAVMAITAGSALISFVVGTFEVRVGKASGHPSMVADGKETLGDGLIETVIFVGVVAEYGLDAVWVEYPLGLGVAFLVARTGRELLSDGMAGLLQRSLGREVEDAIREACLTNHGVREVEQVKTFRVGDGAVCILKILTDAPAGSHDDVKKALKLRLSARLAELGIKEAEFHLRFSRLPISDVRVAYAAVTDGSEGEDVTVAVVPEIAQATHFVICDLKNGEAVRWTLEAPPEACKDRLLDWLLAKRVARIFVFGDRQATTFGPIPVHGVPSYNLRTLGLEEPPAI